MLQRRLPERFEPATAWRSDRASCPAVEAWRGWHTQWVTPRQRIALVVAALLVVGACGSTQSEGEGVGAAEPAKSPPLRTTPAGEVFDVGQRPQGLAYDETTGLLAVAVHDPYRILLLDARSLTVVKVVRLPGKARHLTTAGPGGPILVPDETADQLIEVNLPDGSTRATAVGHHPHNSVVEPNGDILVANEFSHSISRVRSGRLIRTAPGVDQPGGLVVDGDVVGAVDVNDFTVKTFDRASLKVVDETRVGAGPTHGLMTTSHRMVVADTRGGSLYVLGLRPLKILGSYDLPGSPYGMINDPETGDIWVTLTGRNKLFGFSFATDTPTKFAKYDTVRQPDTVAVAPGGHVLWVTGTRDGVIQRITR